MADRIQLELIDITPSSATNGAYVMALSETNGNRSLAIVIGPAEAHSIVIVMEKMPVTRPLTHDLFVALTEEFQMVVQEVYIYQMIEGIFYARIVVRAADKTVEIDARTSDAVAIAIRYSAPIFCEKKVMDEVGRDMRLLEEDVELEDELELDLEEITPSKQTKEELEARLEEALANEDYELASRLRDEIEKLKG
jgi:bifunctional DNase/RNase